MVGFVISLIESQYRSECAKVKPGIPAPDTPYETVLDRSFSAWKEAAEQVWREKSTIQLHELMVAAQPSSAKE